MKEIKRLLWLLLVILLLLWAGGFFIANVGSLIHILLVVALVVLIYNVFTYSRRGGPPAV